MLDVRFGLCAQVLYARLKRILAAPHKLFNLSQCFVFVFCPLLGQLLDAISVSEDLAKQLVTQYAVFHLEGTFSVQFVLVSLLQAISTFTTRFEEDASWWLGSLAVFTLEDWLYLWCVHRLDCLTMNKTRSLGLALAERFPHFSMSILITLI